MRIWSLLMLLLVSPSLSCQPPETSTLHEQITSMVLEIWNTGNLDLIEEVYAPEYVRHYVDIYDDIVGIAGMREWVTYTRSVAPDFTLSIDEQINTDDRIVTRWTVSGTHAVPGTVIKKEATMHGTSISKIAQGKVVEDWVYFNEMSTYRQLGYTIQPPIGE